MIVTILVILASALAGGFSVYRVIKAEKGFLKSIKVFFNW